MSPDPSLLDRFAMDLDALIDSTASIGIGVSGGADSLALLLLAAAVRPGRIEAATVDHGLRAESPSEAEMVATICAQLGVPHAVLRIEWSETPTANLQAQAREARYRALANWAVERGVTAIATAHHEDDQAETVLMRLARGSGISGLAGIQRSRQFQTEDRTVALIRPLLGWRREELRKIVETAGVQPVYDPSNSDSRFDRSKARRILETSGWFQPSRLAAVASNAVDAEEAIAWTAAKELGARQQQDGETLALDPAGLPRELQRRLLLAAIEQLTGKTPSGPKLIQALEVLGSGGTTTLAGLKLEGGASWRLSPAPSRKR